MNQHTAAVIIISEDILSGRKEFNSCETLPLSLVPKWTVTKLIVLPPNLQLVKYELETAFKMCEIVIVIQEINHVDFNVCKIIANLFNEEVKSGGCDVNIPFKLFSANDSSVHVINFQRIFILQGDVATIKLQFNILKLYLTEYKKQLKYRKKFEITLNNNSQENVLNKIQSNGVDIKVEKKNQKFVITAEAVQLDALIKLEENIANEVGSRITRKFADLDIFNSYYFQVDPIISQTVKIIEKCFETYGPENVFVGFNGGKDCTVLLHLTLAVLQKNYPNAENPLCMYVRSEYAFPEQDAFILECQNYYNLKIITINTYIKEGLQNILEIKPNLKACLMGTRRTDPYSDGLKTFQLTDSDWPQVVRVSPLLDWHYSYIWDYLLYFKVPYCSLYNEGYTSLGNRINTVKNPSLCYFDVLQDKEVYLPAYKLTNAKEERNGRS